MSKQKEVEHSGWMRLVELLLIAGSLYGLYQTWVDLTIANVHGVLANYAWILFFILALVYVCYKVWKSE